MKGRGDGAHADAWIGHTLVHPAKGKLAIGGAPCTQASMIGATLRAGVPDTDFERPGRRIIEPSETAGHAHHDTVHAMNTGTATHDDWRAAVKSRRHFGRVPRRHPPGATDRSGLGDILQADSVSAAEAARNRLRWAEDIPVTGKQRLPTPGADDPSAGAVCSYTQSLLCLGLGHHRLLLQRQCVHTVHVDARAARCTWCCVQGRACCSGGLRSRSAAMCAKGRR
jgi:hypothetical protein